MKNIIKLFIAILSGYFTLASCSNLDLNPLSEGSVETWYSTETEIEMTLNDLYRTNFWPLDNDYYTDDYVYRETNHPLVNGTFNGQSSEVTSLWTDQYKAIARANTILANMDKAASLGIAEAKIKQFTAEAYFMRACMYARLVTYFGDVVYLTETVDIDQAFKIGRTKKAEVIKKVYDDFDKAIADLPVKYTTVQRATRGAAMALKARFALYNSDWAIVEKATKDCMDLNIYQLHSNFTNLFLATTRNAKESIFLLPRSIEKKVTFGNWMVMNLITRNSGGYGAFAPSWDLLASFLCTDGLPIDESPLFDSHDPFKNRDPRCNATIIPFGSKHLGFDYNPHPDALQVMNYKTGKMQKNNDTRANAQYASFNGLLFKKAINETWLENGKDVAQDNIIIRYADVLLMYAEAKIEQNNIDQSVLDAINTVRARAYEVDKSATSSYPSVTTMEQKKLREIIRYERRMEFANEGLRYMDLVRWKIAEKALTNKNYGMLYPVSELKSKVINKGLWFWPSTPQMDENGIPDFSAMEKAGLIQVLSQRNWDNRQYLWPIPTKEILINENLKQNEGY